MSAGRPQRDLSTGKIQISRPISCKGCNCVRRPLGSHWDCYLCSFQEKEKCRAELEAACSLLKSVRGPSISRVLVAFVNMGDFSSISCYSYWNILPTNLLILEYCCRSGYVIEDGGAAWI